MNHKRRKFTTALALAVAIAATSAFTGAAERQAGGTTRQRAPVVAHLKV